MEQAERERELHPRHQARLHASTEQAERALVASSCRSSNRSLWQHTEQYLAEGEECLVANDPASTAAEPQLSLMTALTGPVDGSAAVLDINVFPALSSPSVWPLFSDRNHPIS